MRKTAKTVTMLSLLGVASYVAYKNKDKIMSMAHDVSELMKKETSKLEDMM